ncbi:hypothetical protein GOV04_02555 [Candidatus Woesearchaeota archaeon]|nr:hypothetical protein [Candidatus Woesearchaeota archaeon]
MNEDKIFDLMTRLNEYLPDQEWPPSEETIRLLAGEERARDICEAIKRQVPNMILSQDENILVMTSQEDELMILVYKGDIGHIGVGNLDYHTIYGMPEISTPPIEQLKAVLEHPVKQRPPTYNLNGVKGLDNGRVGRGRR